MKQIITVFLVAGIVALPHICYAEKTSSQTKSVYKTSDNINSLRKETPIEMGTISGKFFQDDLPANPPSRI